MNPVEKDTSHEKSNEIMLEVGLAIGIFGKRAPVEDDFRILGENGIRMTEIVSCPGWLEVGDKKTIENIVEWASKYNVAINSVHGPSGSPNHDYGGWLADPDEEKRKYAVEIRKKALEDARILGAKYMVVEFECYTHSPFWPHESKIEKEYNSSFDLWAQSMEELIEAAVHHGINLAVENIDGLSCAKQMEMLSKWGTETVSVCFDSSHATGGPEDFYENLGVLLPRIATTHLSDNDGLQGSEWKDRHWFPFNGAIDWDNLIGSMIAGGYRGCIMLEVLDYKNKTITQELMDSVSSIRKIIEKR